LTRLLTALVLLVLLLLLLSGCTRLGFSTSAPPGDTQAGDQHGRDLASADRAPDRGSNDRAPDRPWTVLSEAGLDLGRRDKPVDAKPVDAKPVQKDLPASGTCPCAAMYTQHYKSINALLWPTCTTPQSSNGLLRYPVDQAIEASLIDEPQVITVTIGSHSSLSPIPSLKSSCFILTDGGKYLAGPLAITDADHMACVNDILLRESICRGCNWTVNC